MLRFPYQVGLFGDFDPHEAKIRATIVRRFQDLGYEHTDVSILSGEEIRLRERRAPFAALFIGRDQSIYNDSPLASDILQDSVVILPLVEDLSKFSSSVPESLRHINGRQIDPNDPQFERDTNTVIENFRLLRKDRRLFISYKRDDARGAALQLYEALDARGFDVFLDTHGVPPGEDFQAVLWHRLADSDVVVLLDTANFYESRWTIEEVTRANATCIQILHVLWPGRAPTAEAALNSFFPLADEDFTETKMGADAQLKDAKIDEIVITVESIRARALAVRHRFLVDAFCDEARRLGVDPSVQPARHITFEGKTRKGFVVPLVGVPSAQRLHDVYQSLEKEGGGVVWVLYDNRGLLRATLEHLKWLNLKLPLQAISVYDIAKKLRRVASR
jgi:hypothetical protein